MRKNNLTQSGFLISRLALAATLFSAAGFLAFYSFAATPDNGTLTDTSGRITYTSGPFLVSNPSATAELICDPPVAPCDDYRLTVTVPAEFQNTHNVVITTSWPNVAEDFDVYLYDENPPVEPAVKDAASSSDPEIITIDAVSGVYTIRIVPFAVAGGTTTTTIDLVQKPTSTVPDPPGPGTPRFHNFPAPPALGNSSGEPTLAPGKASVANPDGRTMYISGLETLRVTWEDCSSPATAPGFPENPAFSRPLWEDRSFVTTSITSLDPILFGDFETGRTFVSQLGPKTSFLAYTDNDGGEGPGEPVAGVDYRQSQGSGINSGVDHQTVGGGPFRPGLPDGTDPLMYKNAVYYASQDLAVAQLGLSRDGGQTFGAAVPMYNLTQCGGLHGHVKVTPNTPATVANDHVGTVYIPNKGCAGQQAVVVSEDEGLTFAVRKVPFSSPGPTDPSLGIDNAGKIYFAFGDGDGRAKVAVSSDKGVTWSIPVDVGAPFGIKNAIFPTAVGGDAGRAAVMYLATDTGGNYEATNVFRGVWHIYSAHTFDGGLTWTTVRVTPENDPVQRGSICTGGTTCGADRNLLDFNDMEVDREGRVIMAYADGCVGCVSPTGADSRADKATIARQSGGKRLFAGFGPEDTEPNPPAAPTVVTVAPDASGVVKVDWLEPDNGGSAITGYNVFRTTTQGVYGAPLAANLPPNKTDYDDTSAVAGTTYYYKVTALNGAGEGEGPSCGEFVVGDAVIVETRCALPGITIATDAAGNNNTRAPQRDILRVSVAELFDPNVAANKLFFTIKVGNLAPLPPPESRWTVFFTRGTTEWFVTMSTETDETATNGGQPVYRYGHTTAGTGGVRSLVTDGNLDFGSNSPDGSILLVISTPTRTNMGASGLSFPALVTGEILGNINATTQQVAGVLLVNDNPATSPGTYTLAGNASCAPNTAPVAALTASPTAGNAPLAVTFDAAGSSDADGDTPLTYTFNFGEPGAADEPAQASPTAMHTYNSDGVYRATVRVTDARGKVSENLGAAFINVGAIPEVVSRRVHGPAGATTPTFDIPLPLSGSPGIECRVPAPGGRYQIVFSFPSAVTFASANMTGTGSVESTSGNGTAEVTVNLMGVANEQTIGVTLVDVSDDNGATKQNVGVPMGVLLGDTSADGVVNSADITQTRRQSGQTPTSENFRTDLTADGVTNVADITEVRRASGTALP